MPHDPQQSDAESESDADLRAILARVQQAVDTTIVAQVAAYTRQTFEPDQLIGAVVPSSLLASPSLRDLVSSAIRASGGDPDALWSLQYPGAQCPHGAPIGGDGRVTNCKSCGTTVLPSPSSSSLQGDNRYTETIPLYKTPVCKDCRKYLRTPYEIKAEQCFGCFDQDKRLRHQQRDEEKYPGMDHPTRDSE